MEVIKLKRIVIKEELYAITNDTIESIILGQFIYWQERVKDYDLFLYDKAYERLKMHIRQLDLFK